METNLTGQNKESREYPTSVSISWDEMKEGDLLPTTAIVLAGGKPSPAAGDAALFGRGRCKFWTLAAISLLAFWSMLAGTVTLKWSAGNLNGFSDDIDSSFQGDLDILEVEEREMVVRHMWDVYTHSRRIRLPRFWQEAFEAAYEDLASDEAEVRDAAVTEIARMSMRMVDLEPQPRKAKHLFPQNSEAEINQAGRYGTTKPKSSSSA